MCPKNSRVFSTDLCPPTDAQSTHEVGNSDAKYPVYRPVVGNANVSQIVSGEYELVPQEPVEEGSGLIPPKSVGDNSDDEEECVTNDLWSVASNVPCLIKASICDSLVQSLICPRMGSLSLE